ncbi:MAG TPA: DNA polymerase III subunit gamma/tau [Casimicrobiaceae bacterium]|nr:DNA polymerase III subunit gamma/tau [Casimicrobiaceae bacterium]
MSYQVLARKWRPRTFAELSGQAHVVTALTNALSRGRLHHAYLLTGTRGVGKTTIARILAKSLNCITNGVTATPCGTCAACTEIDAGRFVDLLELDAASNTGIDNMREILDNARYAPTVGRYKVYLIDEVHMLSKAAFNSMLKTLEEPPEHVKFVLATTDPQKIPVTVLSRCLQFNLKPLPPAVIEARLAHILGEEKIAFDAAGLPLIARAAQGSLRDALSLLDQAIAFGAGEVREGVVRPMLGAVDRDHIYRIVDALVDRDGPALVAEADALAERGLAFATALDELASLFHRIAVAQVVAAAVDAYDDADRVRAYAQALTPDAVQLAYQICAQGRNDLPLAPDEATGFSMTLLRLLAFEPAGGGASREEPRALPRHAAARDTPNRETASPAPSSREPALRPVAPPRSAPVADPSLGNVAALRAAAPRDPVRPETAPPAVGARLSLPEDPAQWPALVAALGLTGMAAQLAAQTAWISLEGNALTLSLPASHKHLADKSYADKLKAALETATGRKLLLAFAVGEAAGSLAAQERKAREEAHAQGEQAFRDEPFVRDLISRFDGRVKTETIQPIRGGDPPST